MSFAAEEIGPRFLAGVKDVDGAVAALAEALAGAEKEGLERATLSVAAAYTLAALFVLYERSEGVAVGGHPVMREMQRLQLYVRKVKKLLGEGEAPEEPKDDPQRPRIKTEVAKRFVRNGMAGKRRGGGNGGKGRR